MNSSITQQEPAAHGAPAQPRGQAPAPEQLVLQLAVGKWLSQALKVAAELGVADQLAEGALAVEELATRCGANADALYRVLRALAGCGVFTERPDRAFENNALSGTLRSDAPRSVRAMVRWVGEEAAWHAWADLIHSVRTGQPAFDHVHGEQVFEYFAHHPETAEIFNAAMTSFSATVGPSVARAYDFGRFRTLVDVGGGQGGLLLAIAERFPHLRCVLYERAEVIATAGPVLSSTPLGRRIEPRAGDFLQAVPAGGDGYLMKHIIHDWDDERCVQILARCAEAVARDGRILVVDQVVGDGPNATFSRLMDLEMLAMTPGGRERTEAELAGLFERAGLELTRIVPTESPVSIAEGVPARRLH